MSEEQENILELSTGVKLSVHKPSVFVIRAIEKKNQSLKPKPPMVMIEEKQREEPNDQHPDYLKALEEWEADGTERQYDVAIMTGTKLYSVPDDFPKPESEIWHDVLTLIDIPLGATEQQRYTQWVKFIAAPNPMDMGLILAKVMSMLGIRESEVAEAVEAFRSATIRRTDSDGTVDGSSENGNKQPANNGRAGSTVRRVGSANKT